MNCDSIERRIHEIGAGQCKVSNYVTKFQNREI